MQGKKGQWVQIRSIVLEPKDRAPQVPDDTKETPFVMWCKGYLKADANLDAECEITTVTGREIKGILEQIEPSYTHGFGKYVPELDIIRDQVRKTLGA